MFFFYVYSQYKSNYLLWFMVYGLFIYFSFGLQYPFKTIYIFAKYITKSLYTFLRTCNKYYFKNVCF